MASVPNPGGAQHNSGPYSPRAERAKLEEALGKMAITDEEATPLVIDDTEDDKPVKWLLAGRILHKNLLHIQTISGALKPAWGNPRGLQFRFMGENTFVAEFETRRDRDRIWEGSPWHVSRNDVVLAEFDDCMRADEVKLDRPSLWARVPNLPYNLHIYCSTPGPRDTNGELPFGPKLRASDDWKKASSGDSSNKEHYSGTSNQRESKNSSSSAKGGTAEVNSPVKNRMNNKRKEVPKQAYRRVTESKLLITDGSEAVDATTGDQVKSAYRALMTHNEHSAQVEGQAIGTSVDQHRLWKMLWSLKVIPKCSHARRYWAEAQALLDVQLPALESGSWQKDILSVPCLSSNDRATIITIMWAIWTSRNKWTREGEKFDPVQSIKFITESLAVLEIPNEQAATLPGYGWQPPEGNQIKINTDAAVDVLSQRSDAGGVARSSCSLLGAWGKPQLGVTDPLIAEGLALREGVIFASLRGFSEVVMDTDCLEVVNLLRDRRDGRSVVATIFSEIEELSLMFSSFNGCNFWHSEREYVAILVKKKFLTGANAADAIGWSEDRREELERRNEQRRARAGFIRGPCSEERINASLLQVGRQIVLLLKIVVAVEEDVMQVM
ncbi:Casein kinase I-2-like protein [Hordeum vulgare]|nr:Casein kinase I-2-like protein [Hordeum vulgare]